MENPIRESLTLCAPKQKSNAHQYVDNQFIVNNRAQKIITDDHIGKKWGGLKI